MRETETESVCGCVRETDRDSETEIPIQKVSGVVEGSYPSTSYTGIGRTEPIGSL